MEPHIHLLECFEALRLPNLAQHWMEEGRQRFEAVQDGDAHPAIRSARMGCRRGAREAL